MPLFSTGKACESVFYHNSDLAYRTFGVSSKVLRAFDGLTCLIIPQPPVLQRRVRSIVLLALCACSSWNVTEECSRFHCFVLTASSLFFSPLLFFPYIWIWSAPLFNEQWNLGGGQLIRYTTSHWYCVSSIILMWLHGTPHRCRLGSVAGCFIYADVRNSK